MICHRPEPGALRRRPVLRQEPAGVDARRRLADALLDRLKVGDPLAAEHDGSVRLAHFVLVDEPLE